jgi:hypothetical protein
MLISFQRAAGWCEEVPIISTKMSSELFPWSSWLVERLTAGILSGLHYV